MHIVKLDATDSTNQYLKELMFSRELEDFTIVITDKQLNGRGQMGAKWEAEPGKNLTLSILKKNKNLDISDQFLLNICTSLALIETLKGLSIPDLTVKWPNDILSGNLKICGILIENVLSGNQIQASILGIGLNVNQLTFNTLSNVSSLKLLLGRTLILEELLPKIIENLKRSFAELEKKNFKGLWEAYESNLFRKDKPSTFKNNQGDLFMGFIRKISPQGKLLVELEDSVFKEYDLKEIRLLY